jgi:hypothetical protein
MFSFDKRDNPYKLLDLDYLMILILHDEFGAYLHSNLIQNQQNYRNQDCCDRV